MTSTSLQHTLQAGVFQILPLQVTCPLEHEISIPSLEFVKKSWTMWCSQN